MKKIFLAILAVIFTVSGAFASEINLKLGEDINYLFGTLYTRSSLSEGPETTYAESYQDSITGFPGAGVSFSAEILGSLTPIFKAGFGFGYIATGGTNEFKLSENSENGQPAFGYAPFYFTLQANPFPDNLNNILSNIFVKGNVGYSLFYISWDDNFQNIFGDPNTKETLDGGLYFELAAGYEFPFGLILQLSYAQIQSSAVYRYEVSGYDEYGIEPWTASARQEFKLSYRKVGISAGYKFKL